MFEFLRTRQWIVARRVVLVVIVLFVALNRYGGGLSSLLYRPNPKADIEITRAEFRADIPAARPVWIIGFRNASRRFTYDAIQLEADYFDNNGTLLQKDKLVVHQRLEPLEEKSLASPDFKERPNA